MLGRCLADAWSAIAHLPGQLCATISKVWQQESLVPHTWPGVTICHQTHWAARLLFGSSTLDCDCNRHFFHFDCDPFSEGAQLPSLGSSRPNSLSLAGRRLEFCRLVLTCRTHLSPFLPSFFFPSFLSCRHFRHCRSRFHSNLLLLCHSPSIVSPSTATGGRRCIHAKPFTQRFRFLFILFARVLSVCAHSMFQTRSSQRASSYKLAQIVLLLFIHVFSTTEPGQHLLTPFRPPIAFAKTLFACCFDTLAAFQVRTNACALPFLLPFDLLLICLFAFFSIFRYLLCRTTHTVRLSVSTCSELNQTPSKAWNSSHFGRKKEFMMWTAVGHQLTMLKVNNVSAKNAFEQLYLLEFNQTINKYMYAFFYRDKKSS